MRLGSGPVAPAAFPARVTNKARLASLTLIRSLLLGASPNADSFPCPAAACAQSRYERGTPQRTPCAEGAPGSAAAQRTSRAARATRCELKEWSVSSRLATSLGAPAFRIAERSASALQ